MSQLKPGRNYVHIRGGIARACWCRDDGKLIDYRLPDNIPLHEGDRVIPYEQWLVMQGPEAVAKAEQEICEEIRNLEEAIEKAKVDLAEIRKAAALEMQLVG